MILNISVGYSRIVYMLQVLDWSCGEPRCAGTKSAPGMVKKTISKSGHKSVSGSYVLLANHRIFESDKSSIYEYLT